MFEPSRDSPWGRSTVHHGYGVVPRLFVHDVRMHAVTCCAEHVSNERPSVCPRSMQAGSDETPLNIPTCRGCARESRCPPLGCKGEPEGITSTNVSGVGNVRTLTAWRRSGTTRRCVARKTGFVVAVYYGARSTSWYGSGGVCEYLCCKAVWDVVQGSQRCLRGRCCLICVKLSFHTKRKGTTRRLSK